MYKNLLVLSLCVISMLFVISDSLACCVSDTGPLILLTFEGLKDGEVIGNFYSGGFGGNGSGPGPNFGVTFSNNAQAFIDIDAGGSGNFGGEPSPDTALSFLFGNSFTMNLTSGWKDSFSFYYSSPVYTGSVTVYDNLDGTGNVLGSIGLPLTPDTGAPDPNGRYSPLVPMAVTFNGVAKSVDFGGTAWYIVWDDIGFGSGSSGSSIPEPSTMLLLGSGLIGLAGYGRRKFFKK